MLKSSLSYTSSRSAWVERRKKRREGRWEAGRETGRRGRDGEGHIHRETETVISGHFLCLSGKRAPTMPVVTSVSACLCFFGIFLACVHLFTSEHHLVPAWFSGPLPFSIELGTLLFFPLQCVCVPEYMYVHHKCAGAHRSQKSRKGHHIL